VTGAAIALVWTAIAIAAGMLIGRAIRLRDTFPAQVWPQLDDDWLADQPVDTWPQSRFDAEIPAFEREFQS
jgi:hypothetical protein